MIKIEEINRNNKPKLLLHCCCAPCSSYVLQYLNEYFHITAFFYNPNIEPISEYDLRYEELKRLVSELQMDVDIIKGDYDDSFILLSKGLETIEEGKERCILCYQNRLEKTVKLAVKLGFDAFTTTLSISPHKNAKKLNEIGIMLEEKYHCSYLYSDFKKNDGYKKSIEYSKKYNLYRQNYCGCKFSKKIT